MKLIFATNNQNKLSELTSLISSQINILSLRDIECFQQLKETGETLTHNALQKARFIFKNYAVNCFADDTGLEINSLDGAPGIYSARYAGESSVAENNIKKVLFELKGNQQRSATFRTIIALIIDGKEIIFEGICKGNIAKEKKGSNGFGYDPIFIPEGFGITFAQMSQDEKSAISHRGKAVMKLVHFLNKNFI